MNDVRRGGAVISRRIAIIVLLLLPLTFFAFADDGALPKNFGQINENYYRGGQPKAGHFAALRRLGIRAIVNLRKNGPREEAELARAAGMKYFYLPLSSRHPATPEEIQQFLSIVNDPANWPVYVHCAAGKHRTGGMTAVHRITHDQWTADLAYQEMDRYGFYSFPNHGSWKKFVYKFYDQQKADKPSRP